MTQQDAMRIRFCRRTGTLRAIYDDRLLPYIDRLRSTLGLPASAVKISRATYVEPCTGGEANWQVDLSPVGGPSLRLHDEEGQPFVTRESALSFERRWLTQNWLNSNDGREVRDVGVEP